MRLLASWFPRNARAIRSTEDRQHMKVCEEALEFHKAFVGESRERAVEEVIDTMVAIDGWLDKQDPAVVMDAIDLVIKKGKERGDW